MGLRVKHLDTDVVRSCIQMVLHTSANRFHVTPCDERVDETVAALPTRSSSVNPRRRQLLV